MFVKLEMPINKKIEIMKLGYRMLLSGIAIFFSTMAISQEMKPIDGDKPIKQKVVSKRFEAKHKEPIKKKIRFEMKEENIRKVN